MEEEKREIIWFRCEQCGNNFWISESEFNKIPVDMLDCPECGADFLKWVRIKDEKD